MLNGKLEAVKTSNYHAQLINWKRKVLKSEVALHEQHRT